MGLELAGMELVGYVLSVDIFTKGDIQRKIFIKAETRKKNRGHS